MCRICRRVVCAEKAVSDNCVIMLYTPIAIQARRPWYALSGQLRAEKDINSDQNPSGGNSCVAHYFKSKN